MAVLFFIYFGFVLFSFGGVDSDSYTLYFKIQIIQKIRKCPITIYKMDGIIHFHSLIL